jgi:hypothetical protein
MNIDRQPSDAVGALPAPGARPPEPLETAYSSASQTLSQVKLASLPSQRPLSSVMQIAPPFNDVQRVSSRPARHAPASAELLGTSHARLGALSVASRSVDSYKPSRTLGPLSAVCGSPQATAR